MMRDGPDGGQPEARAKSPGADLAAKVADLESSLEDALRLKREVETQAEIIRVLTRRVEEERQRAEQMAHPLGALRSKLIYHTKVALYRPIHHTKVALYRLSYHTKVAVYREIPSAAKWRRAVQGRYRRKAAERVPVNRSTPCASPSPPGGDGKPFEVGGSSDSSWNDTGE
jgi:hypothetical protein